MSMSTDTRLYAAAIGLVSSTYSIGSASAGGMRVMPGQRTT